VLVILFGSLVAAEITLISGIPPALDNLAFCKF
jgi:hypothetical protein